MIRSIFTQLCDLGQVGRLCGPQLPHVHRACVGPVFDLGRGSAVGVSDGTHLPVPAGAHQELPVANSWVETQCSEDTPWGRLRGRVCGRTCGIWAGER